MKFRVVTIMTVDIELDKETIFPQDRMELQRHVTDAVRSLYDNGKLTEMEDATVEYFNIESRMKPAAD